MADNQQLENDFIAISRVSRESSDLNEMCPRCTHILLPRTIIENRFIRYNSTICCLINTKFGTKKQNHIQTQIT